MPFNFYLALFLSYVNNNVSYLVRSKEAYSVTPSPCVSTHGYSRWLHTDARAMCAGIQKKRRDHSRVKDETGRKPIPSIRFICEASALNASARSGL